MKKSKQSTNQNFNFPRGSEWRKWDLHVHTPESDGFKGTWEEFKIQLQNADCAVIGINDYFSVAGYKKLKEEIKNNTLDIGDKTILPVVEMRMTDSLQNRNTNTNATTHFNFHIIFNDKLDIDDIESFIKSLESSDSIIGSDYNDKEKLKNKKVSFKDTVKKLQSDKKFKDNFLIWLPYDEYGGIDKIDPKSDGWIKADFIKKSHILGSSNKKQINFFLWKSELKTDGTPKFTQEQFKEWFGYKKPCIKGSDSHSKDYPIGKLKDKDSNPIEKFCWIKADPTFEGLRQIVYEPEDRVKIQEEKPEQKEPYNLIDSIKFIDSKSNFTDKEILLNQNLNVIIGGKSTGKSILLREIARIIDPDEVKRRLEEAHLEDYRVYRKNIEKGGKLTDDFIVKWIDGIIDSRNDNNREKKRKIIYIPQSYLNSLVDEEEVQSPIDKLIEDILKNDDNIKDIFNELKYKENENSKNISTEIENLFASLNKEKEINEEIKRFGDKEGIKKYIEKIKNEIKSLQEKGGLIEEEIKKYDYFKGQIDNLNNDLNSYKEKEKVFKKALNIDKFYFTDEFNNILEKYDELNKKASDILKKVNSELNNYLKKEIESLLEEIQRKQIKKEELEKEIKPLIEKVKNDEIIKRKNEFLKEEENKLSQIEKKEKELKYVRNKKEDAIKKLIDYFIEYYNIKNNFRSRLENNYSLGKDLEFKVIIKAKNKEFNMDFIEDIFNMKSLPGEYKDFEFNLDNNDFRNQIEKLLLDILQNKIKLKSKYETKTKEIIQKLFQDWFIINYEITYDGDKVSDMSPGKKSFVLLRLIVELDKSKCPLLIDQPEDNLDNRSIYNEVVKFIKEKKKERQIIIVTHNSNLAVSTDAECIIVANQDGQKNKNKKFKFEYVQGSLEKTFKDPLIKEILYKQGIKEHICEILEGGKEAFKNRRNKYNF